MAGEAISEIAQGVFAELIRNKAEKGFQIDIFPHKLHTR